jgi:hypothetical protein
MQSDKINRKFNKVVESRFGLSCHLIHAYEIRCNRKSNFWIECFLIAVIFLLSKDSNG